MTYAIRNLLCLAVLLSSALAQAYITGRLSKAEINFNTRTHILVAGIGKELGTQFQAAAIAKGLKILENHPNDQVYYIGMVETELEENLAQLKWRGLKIIEGNKSDLKEEKMFKDLQRFSKIASISFFGHSAAHVGLLLQNKYDRFNYTSEFAPLLKGHFTTDAYVHFYSCNAGFFLAPKMARIWKVPTVGALTSTDFEQLHVDGQWYVNTQGSYPEGGWSKENSVSYNNSIPCKTGLCIRMKPDNHPYNGFWGNYRNGGLSIYKFFCPKTDEETCVKAMASSLLNQVSSFNVSLESPMKNLMQAAAEYLCPNNKTGEMRKVCMQALFDAIQVGNETYNPYRKQTLQCDYRGCYFGMTCVAPTLIPFPSKCEIDNPVQGPTSTLVGEFKQYIKGFQLLKKENGLPVETVYIAPVNSAATVPGSQYVDTDEGHKSRVDFGWN